MFMNQGEFDSPRQHRVSELDPPEPLFSFSGAVYVPVYYPPSFGHCQPKMAGLCLLEPQIQTTRSQLLKIAACQWQLVGTPAAVAWSAARSGLASEAPWSGPAHLILQSRLRPLPSLLAPPASLQEASSLGSRPPPKRFTEHICDRLENVFFWYLATVSKCNSVYQPFHPLLFSIIYTSCCLVAEAIVFGN